jgi:predicted Fe-S protein YdhL (DUF1289 family)
VIISPCTKVCKLVDGFCEGCQRTRAEIMTWSKLTEQQRLEIMELLPSRRVTHTET